MKERKLKNRLDNIADCAEKVSKEIEFAHLFDDIFNLMDCVTPSEDRKQKQKIIQKIYKMHNSLYAIEQMINNIKLLG